MYIATRDTSVTFADSSVSAEAMPSLQADTDPPDETDMKHVHALDATCCAVSVPMYSPQTTRMVAENGPRGCKSAHSAQEKFEGHTCK